MLNLPSYVLHVSFVSVKFMCLADTLSEANLPIQNADLWRLRNWLCCSFHNPKLFNYNFKSWRILRSYSSWFVTADSHEILPRQMGDRRKEIFQPILENTGIFKTRSIFWKATFWQILELLFFLNCSLNFLLSIRKIILVSESARHAYINCYIGYECRKTFNR